MISNKGLFPSRCGKAASRFAFPHLRQLPQRVLNASVQVLQSRNRFSSWPGCISGRFLTSAHLLSVSGIDPETPNAACALNASANQFGKAYPIYRVGVNSIDPARSSGTSTNSKNFRSSSPFFSKSNPLPGLSAGLLQALNPSPDNATGRSSIDAPGPRSLFSAPAFLPRRSGSDTIGSACSAVEAATTTTRSRPPWPAPVDCPID